MQNWSFSLLIVIYYHCVTEVRTPCRIRYQWVHQDAIAFSVFEANRTELRNINVWWMVSTLLCMQIKYVRHRCPAHSIFQTKFSYPYEKVLLGHNWTAEKQNCLSAFSRFRRNCINRAMIWLCKFAAQPFIITGHRFKAIRRRQLSSAFRTFQLQCRISGDWIRNAVERVTRLR